MTKRIVSIILTLLLVLAIGATAFAAEDDYDYKTDEALRVSADVLANANEGNYTWGHYSPAYFYPLDKTVHPISDIPKAVDEETGEETDKDLYVDSTSCEPEYEIIRIAAFYVFKCPNCGMAHGDYSLRDLYTKASGTCCNEECGKLLPNPNTLKIYRFIVLDESSTGATTHSKTMRYYDFTKYAKDVYGSTANLYGDGTDLPENSITFAEYKSSLPVRDNQEYNITDIATTSVKAERGDSIKAWLLVFLTKLQYKLGPKLADYADSSWAAFKNNIRVNMANTWESFLIAIVKG